jgi:L-2,4-diaminobutyric acid acetyltransferase
MNARLPEQVSTGSLIFRQPERRDGAVLYDLIAACPPLDLNSRYAYLLVCEHFADTSLIVEQDGVIVGAVTAYIPPAHPDSLFVWQVAVSKQMRGQKLASRMLEHLLTHCVKPRCLRWMEATISPSNEASRNLFIQFAARHDAGVTTTSLFTARDFGSSQHEEELLYRIGPWTR